MTGAAIVLLLVVGFVAGVGFAFVAESIGFGKFIARIERGETSGPCPVCRMCCCAECRDNTRSLKTREILTNYDRDRFDDGAIAGALTALARAEQRIGEADGILTPAGCVEIVRSVAEEARSIARDRGITVPE